MEHELTRGVRGVDSRRNGMHRQGSSASPTARMASLVIPFPRALIQAYKGSGNPGGGRSHQGLITTFITASSRRWTDLFFGGSGPGSSRGAFPFSSAENLLIGAIVVSSGARRKKQVNQEEMGDGGSAPLPIYSGRRPISASHDHR